jgi:hypothetical protein
MSRKKGAPAYPGKKIIGSTYLTEETVAMLKGKEEEIGRSASDFMEHALRKVLPTITANTKLIGLPGKFGPTEATD